MSTAQLRDIAQEALGDAAAVTQVTVAYVDGGRRQRITLAIIDAGGAADTMSAYAAPTEDLRTKIEQMAAAYVAATTGVPHNG